MPRNPKLKSREGSRRKEVPYTMPLPDGRTLLVLVPAPWTETDQSGELAFKPDAVRLLDRVRTLAIRTPKAPTPGFILTLREALGLTQRELGERVGVDKMTVSRWERGTVRPSAAAVRALDRLRRQAARHGVVIAA